MSLVSPPSPGIQRRRLLLSRVRRRGLLRLRHLDERHDAAGAALLPHQRGRHELAVGQHDVQPPEGVEVLPVGRHHPRGCARPRRRVQGVVDRLLLRL